MDVKTINQLLTADIPKFLAFLYGSNPAYERGGIWNMGDAKGAGGDSLKIWTNGSFKDFATGEQGDLVNLASLAWSLPIAQTMSRLKVFLGLEEGPDASFAAIEKSVQALQAPTSSTVSSRVNGTAEWRPLPQSSPWEGAAARPSVVYKYTTRDSVPLFLVGRFEATDVRKKYFQIASYRDSGWVFKAPDITLWPLYGEPELLLYPKDRPVILVEGEKAAEYGRRHLPAYFWTTWHGGASAVKRTDFISLQGRLVVLWPDADEPGQKAMDYVHTLLPEAYVVSPNPSWPSGTDVADLQPEEIQSILQEVLERGESVPTTRERSIAEAHTEPNQLGSVYRFLDRFGADLHFLAEAKQWVFWDGRRWSTDRGGYSWARAVLTVENAFGDCMPWTSGDSKKLTRVENYVQSAKGTGHIKGIIEGASLMEGIPVSETDFDKDADQINVLNGILDLRTGRLSPHSREANMTKLIEHPYEKGAQCPQFLGFLNEIMVGDHSLIEFLQIYFGYSLTGLPPDRIFTIFYGSGRNGKSTLIQIISSIMGDYHVTIRSQSIMSGKDGERPDRIGEDLIPLRGARLATMQESDRGTRLNEGKVKELTGRDVMRCRYLHSNLWLQFVNTGKLILTTNHRPRITGQDPGIWDRVAMVPFEARIEENKIDPDLANKIIEQEAPGVLAWMVEGAMKFYAAGKKVHRPQAVQAATDEYRSDEDMLGKFVEACLTEAKNARVKVSSLMEVYKKWMDANGDHNAILGSRRFTEDIRPVMERSGYQRKKTADGTYYFGCSFTEDEIQESLREVKKDLPAHWSDTGVRDDIY